MTRGGQLILLVVVAAVMPQWIGVTLARYLRRTKRPELSWVSVSVPAIVFAGACLLFWWVVADEANSRSVAATGRPADGTFLLMMFLNTAMFALLHLLVAIALQRRIIGRADERRA
jgi:amino acid transporter